MLYSEIFAVCSEIHENHMNTPCVQKADFGMLDIFVP